MSFFRKSFIIVVFCLLAQMAFAQSTAQEIENLLNTDAVTYAQAARFILQAADIEKSGPGSFTPAEAFNYAVEQNWLPAKVSADDPARLDNISLLLIRSFGINGGLFYSLVGNAHYAYRELVYINVIQNRHNPAMLVSGERLLFYVNRILTVREN